MKNPELQPHVDALIVLGRNFQPGCNRQTLAEQRFHSSPGTRINSLALGILFNEGVSNIAIASTGRTAGSNVISEAEAINSNVRRVFKLNPEKKIILEEDSIDTEGNVTCVKKIIQEHPELHTFGLVSDTSHLERAVPLFEKAGIPIVPFDSLEILKKKRPRYVEHYEVSEINRNTQKQDKKAQIIQNLPFISPITSRLLHLVALRMRNPNRPNPYVK